MDEIISEFQSESKELVGQLIEVLETIEGHYSRYKELEGYGQMVDRIMGAAKSLALEPGDYKDTMEMIGRYAELCKIVSYKASQVGNNESLFNVVVALLLDATEALQEMILGLSKSSKINMKEVLTKTFLDRLRWVSEQFDANLRSSVGVAKTMSQNDIDQVLKSMGFG